MKKIVFCVMIAATLGIQSEEALVVTTEESAVIATKAPECAIESCCSPCRVVAFTAGYVFKPHDAIFRDVYGVGMGNIITIDMNQRVWEYLSFGAKVSYWLAAGHTTFVRRRAILQEIPLTAYIRAQKDTCHGFSLYASIGGGAVWSHEKSYLGKTSFWKGIGEAEVGLNYPWRCVQLTTACRYLFPRQKIGINKATVGGVDLRAGIGISF